jgi:cystathionine beta-synthase
MTDTGADPRLAGTEIVDSVIDTIGETPLIRLKRISEIEDIACVFAMKNEATNPGGSAKDRPALEMILAAEREGLLQPGGTIVEPTSGNTGVGLAIVAAQRGYRCVFVMTDKVAPEKVDLLRPTAPRWWCAPWPSSPRTRRATTASPNGSPTSSVPSGPTSTQNPHNPNPTS